MPRSASSCVAPEGGWLKSRHIEHQRGSLMQCVDDSPKLDVRRQLKPRSEHARARPLSLRLAETDPKVRRAPFGYHPLPVGAVV